jgi:sterol desaturase/sphingolipid hydroxylase (fatty acid hydroxylase superfamily)
MTPYILPFMVITIALLMMLIERCFPSQALEKRAYWWLRALSFNLIQLALVFIAGLSWDRWLQTASLWQGQAVLGTTGGVIVGYIIITFIYYWWHRLRHENAFLWRWLHQLHHSPRRIEIITSFYKHPLEITLNSILSSAILYMLLGLNPTTAAITIAITGLAELLYHWNINTPYWLGFIFQRPESHRIHHQENWHRNNYSDLPVWDMLFGTWQNPRHTNIECGFTDNKELQLYAMLRGIDIHKKARNNA